MTDPPDNAAIAGKVYLVGAGPGASDLVSLRGYRALRSADAILIDRLLPRTFLTELGIPSADKVIRWLGDTTPPWSQARINQWLASQSLHGKTVVRLKGGDPFVFGQADEEAAHLSEWNIPWEAIPGPSSFTAAMTSSGFPITRRDWGQSFSVATARVVGGAVQERFPRSDSLVIMMGIGVLDEVVARLLADGWPADTPAAIVERGTLLWERHVESPLAHLSAAANNARAGSPACVIVGAAADPVAAPRRRPTILFTGLDPANFRGLGNLLHWPGLEVAPNARGRELLPGIFSRLERLAFDWILFAGKIGVASFFEELGKRDLDARSLAGTRIVATGAEIANRLREYGLRPDVTADGDPEEMLASLGNTSNKAILAVEGSHPPRRLYGQLTDQGASISRLALHRVIPHRELGRPLPAHDAIFFVSPGGVRAYWAAYGPAAFEKQVWCLGEETRQSLAEHGIASARVVSPDNATWVPVPTRRVR